MTTYNARSGAPRPSGHADRGVPAPNPHAARRQARLPALEQGKGRCRIYGCFEPTTGTWCDTHGGNGTRHYADRDRR